MPERRVIILEREENGRVRFALWADVPAARQPFYASTGNVSAFKNASSTQLDDLRAGRMAEEVGVVSIDGTVAETATHLESIWTRYQTQVNTFNPWARYGTYLNSTGTWVSTGVS
jgi:hypothetical protein